VGAGGCGPAGAVARRQRRRIVRGKHRAHLRARGSVVAGRARTLRPGSTDLQPEILVRQGPHRDRRRGSVLTDRTGRLHGRFHDTAKLGAGGTLVLRNANHVVLAARGVDQGTLLGQRPTNRVEGELRDGFYAQYWNENRPDRSGRLITARRSRAFPLIFTVGI